MSNLSRMTLQIQVNHQHIVRLDKNIVVEKSKNYLYAHFTFSDDWEGLNKYILVRPYDIDTPVRLTLDSKNTCKIPYDFIVFPGFVISARGENESGEQLILGDGLGIDVELALIEDGDNRLPVTRIISTNNTINIEKTESTVDLGLEMGLVFNPNSSTLTLNAITHNEVDEQGQPITVTTPLATAELNPSVTNIVAEDSHTGGEITTYRNLVFTFTDGTTQRVSIDKFWNEIRGQVNGLDIALNSLSGRVSAIEVDYLTSADKTELEGELSILRSDVEEIQQTLSMSILPAINPKEMSILEQGQVYLLADNDGVTSKINLNDLDFAKLKVISDLNAVRNDDFIFEQGE